MNLTLVELDLYPCYLETNKILKQIILIFKLEKKIYPNLVKLQIQIKKKKFFRNNIPLKVLF